MKGKRFIRNLLGILLLLTTPYLLAADGPDLSMNGVAAYREFGDTVYLGALLTTRPVKDAASAMALTGPRRMEARFVTDLSDRRWVNNWMQSIAINNRKDTVVAAAQALSDALSAFRGNLAAGDRVTIDYSPEDGTSVSINGTTLVQSHAENLFNLFLSAWIGAVPPSTDFKKGILGEAESSLRIRFDSVEPDKTRVAATRQWGGSDNSAKPAELPHADEMPVPPSQPAAIPDEPPALADAEALEDKGSPADDIARPELPTLNAGNRELAEHPQLASLGTAGLSTSTLKKSSSNVSVESIVAQQSYLSQVIGRIYKSVRYPRSSIRRNEQGSVRVTLKLSRNGDIEKTVIAEEAPHRALNDEAIRAIKAAAPYPAFPDGIAEENMEFQVPVAFKLTGG